MYSHNPPKVRVMTKPTKSVQAIEKCGPGELTIVPATIAIVEETEASKIKAATESRTCYEVGVHPPLADQPMFFLKAYGNKHFLSPYWSLYVSDDKSKCNMELQPYVVTTKRAVPENSKRANPNITITFQLAVSSKVIGAGDNLVLYKYLGEKKRPLEKPIALERKAKRAKA